MPVASEHTTRTAVDRWIRLALVVAAFAPFAGTLFYGFIYDDSTIILHNSVIRGWSSLVAVWKTPYWASGGQDTSGLYRPLFMTALALLWNGAHGFAIVFHLFAVALHVTATLLVAALLRRAVGRWPAMVGALWFAVHPVHVEAVASVANSSEVLVCIWALLLVRVLAPDDRDRGDDGLPLGWTRATFAALLFAAALLTKESGAVVPAVALIAAVAWRKPGEARLVREGFCNWRFIVACSVVFAAILVVRRLVLGGLAGAVNIAAPGFEQLSWIDRVWAMFSLGGRIVQLTLWPATQNPHYGPSALPTPPGPTLAAVIAIIVLVCLVAACLWLASRARSRDARPLAAIASFLIAFFPASNLLVPTGQILAERTLYLSSVGAAMLVAWVAEHAIAFVRGREAVPDARRRIASLAMAVIVAFVCARGYLHSRAYTEVWRSHASLFAQMVRADSLNYRGHQLLALEERLRGRLEESAAHYARAYRLRQSDPILATEYGEYLLAVRRPQDALIVGHHLLGFSQVLTNDRVVTVLLNATGAVWGTDSVVAAASRLNARAPSARAALFLGLAYEARGDSTAARRAYRAGQQLAPRDSALLARLSAIGVGTGGD